MRTLTLLSAAVMFVGTLAHTQNGPGGTAGSPFRFGFDARAIGLGNAVSSRAFSDNPGVHNPSLLPFVTSRNIYLGGATLPLDRSLFHLSYSTPLPPSAGLSFSAIGARVGDIQGRDINGTPTEVYSTTEYAVSLAFGLQPGPGFTIGVGAKLLHARLLPELTSTTVGLDFGASYLVADGLLLGVVVKDLNSKYRWDSTPIYGRNGNNTIDQFPRRLIFATSWSQENVPFSLSVEGESVAGWLLFRVGGEYRVHPSVIVRAGADGIDPQQRLGTRVTFGASLENLDVMWSPSLDYAFMSEPFVHLRAHFLTIRFHVGS